MRCWFVRLFLGICIRLTMFFDWFFSLPTRALSSRKLAMHDLPLTRLDANREMLNAKYRCLTLGCALA